VIPVIAASNEFFELPNPEYLQARAHIPDRPPLEGLLKLIGAAKQDQAIIKTCHVPDLPPPESAARR